MNLMQHKIDLIRFITDTNDIRVLEDMTSYKQNASKQSATELTPKEGKDAKKSVKNTIQDPFSRAMLDIFTNFYNKISLQLEEHQLVLDALDAQDTSAEILLLQLRLQIKALQGACYQFLLDLERELKE